MQGQEPSFGGTSFTFTPTVVGVLWIEAEAHWPDGRRVFAAATISTSMQTNESEFRADTQTIALYHFNDSYQDGSGNGFHLVPSGNVALASDNSGWRTDAAGQVVRFAGLGDQLRVQIPDSRIMPGPTTGPITIEARIYSRGYKAYAISNYPIVSLYQDWDTALEVKDGKWNNPHAPTVAAGNATVLNSGQWSSAVAMNTWSKLRVTYSPGGSTQCFINDVLISSTTANSFNPARTNPWTLTLGNFDGDLDEVRISNVVRP